MKTRPLRPTPGAARGQDVSVRAYPVEKYPLRGEGFVAKKFFWAVTLLTGFITVSSYLICKQPADKPPPGIDERPPMPLTYSAGVATMDSELYDSILLNATDSVSAHELRCPDHKRRRRQDRQFDSVHGYPWTLPSDSPVVQHRGTPVPADLWASAHAGAATRVGGEGSPVLRDGVPRENPQPQHGWFGSWNSGSLRRC